MAKLDLVSKGKVCDIFANATVPEKLFFRRTDRFSVGDKVFPGNILYKGLILNQMSLNWMNMLEEQEIVASHLLPSAPISLLRYGATMEDAGCMVVANKCIPVPLECIVRGYYIPESHSWDPYKTTGMLYGNALPRGMVASQELPTPIYTPSTKAAAGQHDENINFEQSTVVLKEFLKEHPEIPTSHGLETQAYTLAGLLKNLSLRVYKFLHAYALNRSIIIADTKLEFGIHVSADGKSFTVVLIDEVGTPDTSRYWDLKTYTVGKPNPSMDKQYLRRYVYQTLGWNSDSEPPVLPPEVLNEASRIYCDIYQRLFDTSVEALSEDVMWEWKKASDELETEEAHAMADKAWESYLAEQ